MVFQPADQARQAQQRLAVFAQTLRQRGLWSQLVADPVLHERTRHVPHIDAGVQRGGQPFDHHHRLLQQQQVRLGLHIEIARDREQPVKHLADRQFAHRLATHRLAHGAQRGRELIHRVIARHILRLEMDLGDAAVIARGQAIEDLGEPEPRAPINPAHDAKIDRGNRAVRLHEEVALVHIGVKIPMADRLGQEGNHQPASQFGQVNPAGVQRGAVADLDPVDPLNRQDPAVGAVPVDPGDAIAVKALHRLGQFRG